VRTWRDDHGSAIVEFTLVGILLTVLFLALLQLGLALHVRNTLVASAAEGARYGANADRNPAQGAAVTRQLIRDSLADSFADGVTSGFETVDGMQTVYVQVDATLPVLGLLGPPRTIRVRGHALEEAP
jgi:Flp pilus assembly protein TadG